MQPDLSEKKPRWLSQVFCVHAWGLPQRNPAFGPSFLSSVCTKCGKVRNGHAIIKRAPAPFLNGLSPIERRHLAR